MIGLATIAAVACLAAQLAGAESRRERGEGRGRDLSVQEHQIRRARHVTRRVLRDRRATPEMKQQATELQAILDRREQMISGLEARHREFVAQHQAELDELQDLAQRARDLDRRLSTARSDLLQSSASDIAALKASSARAAELVEALREGYAQRRRERRQR